MLQHRTHDLKLFVIYIVVLKVLKLALLPGDLLYVIDSSDVVTLNKYTGEKVGTLTIQFESMLTGIKVVHKDQRPKG